MQTEESAIKELSLSTNKVTVVDARTEHFVRMIVGDLHLVSASDLTDGSSPSLSHGPLSFIRELLERRPPRKMLTLTWIYTKEAHTSGSVPHQLIRGLVAADDRRRLMSVQKQPWKGTDGQMRFVSLLDRQTRPRRDLLQALTWTGVPW